MEATSAFQRFCGLVTPGVATVSVLPGESAAGLSWVKPARQGLITRGAAVAAHLLAGDRGRAVPLEGYERERVRGVGFSYREDAMTSRVAIHLPGRVPGYGPAEIVSRLTERVGYGRLLVTSGGPEGGYVCHARVPKMALRAAHRGVAGLLDGIGVVPRAGAVEIHPAPLHGLLPFGLGGREVFQYPSLEFGTECCALELLEHFLDLEPLDLPRPRSATPPRGTAGAVEVRDRAAPAPGTSPLATYLRLVSPGAAIVSVQPRDLARSPTGGWEWLASRADLANAVATHLHVSQTEQPARIGRRFINAVGLSYRADAVIDRGTIDLDGQHGYDPATIVARLAALVGRERLLVTSSSGRAGRYHCHVRFPPMALAAARAALLALLAAVGVSERSGGAEVYPHRKNCRLPFGLGGCDLFEDPELEAGVRLPWQDLTVRLDALPPLNLSPKALRAAGVRPVCPPQKPPRAHGPAAVNVVVDAEARARIERWWREGVRRSERNDALFALACDCQRLGLAKGAAVRRMQRWIDDGNLRQSAEALRPGGIARQRNVVVPYLVARVYAHPPRRREPAHRSGPVNLTPREVAYAVAIAKARCGEAVAQAVVLLLDVLPWFKGAWQKGGDEVRLSRDEWSRTLGRRGGGYAEVRQALRLFAPSAPYVIDECPYTWRLLEAFPFEEGQPARPVVVTRSPRAARWKARWILAQAERVAARVARVAARSRRAAERVAAEVVQRAEADARESANDSVAVTPVNDVTAATNPRGLAAARGDTDERPRAPVSARPGARPGPRSLRGVGRPQGTAAGLRGPPRRPTDA